MKSNLRCTKFDGSMNDIKEQPDRNRGEDHVSMHSRRSAVYEIEILHLIESLWEMVRLPNQRMKTDEYFLYLLIFHKMNEKYLYISYLVATLY